MYRIHLSFSCRCGGTPAGIVGAPVISKRYTGVPLICVYTHGVEYCGSSPSVDNTDCSTYCRCQSDNTTGKNGRGIPLESCRKCRLPGDSNPAASIVGLPDVVPSGTNRRRSIIAFAFVAFRALSQRLSQFLCRRSGPLRDHLGRFQIAFPRPAHTLPLVHLPGPHQG